MASHEQEREQRDVPQPDVSGRAPSTSREKRPTTERILSDGLRFGNYKVVRLIAVGGMSEVYEAIHVKLRKRVALKVMRPDLAESPQAQRSFLAEGMNAARIRHTNVVDVTDVGVVGDLPYLVMALLEGEDLAVAYARQGRFQTADLVDLLLPVSFAVAIGHCHGVVHRDLKPGNIFLHQEGCRLIPKVLDFGVSRLLGALRTKTPGRVFGTPFYMAPEQARGEPSDTRADQYAVGVMLYQGLTGRLPRDSEDAEALLHTVAYDSLPCAPPSSYVELPAELNGAICRAMSYDPEQRFASMHDLARALLPFASPEASRYWTEELNSLPNVGPNGRAVAPLTPRRSQPPRPSVPPLPKRIDEPSVAGEQPAAPTTLKSHPPPPIPDPQPSAAEPPARDAGREPTARFAPDWPRREVVESVAAPAESFAKRHRKLLGLAGAALLALGGIWVAGSSSGGGTTTTSPATVPPVPNRSARHIDVDVRVTPATAVLLLDQKQVAVGHYTARLLHDGTTHELRGVAEGFVTRSLWFRDEAPQRVLELAPAAVTPAVATASSHPVNPAALKQLALRKPPRKSVGAAWQPRASAQLNSVDSDRNSNDSVALQSASVGVVDLQQPKVRIVDDEQPRVHVIE